MHLQKSSLSDTMASTASSEPTGSQELRENLSADTFLSEQTMLQHHGPQRVSQSPHSSMNRFKFNMSAWLQGILHRHCILIIFAANVSRASGDA